MPRKKASTARKSKPAGKRAKTKAPARAALKSKSARAPATKNSEASIPEPKQADTTMPAPSDSRAEDLARTATELKKRAPALLSVGSEKLSVFTALDGWDFVTFRAEASITIRRRSSLRVLLCDGSPLPFASALRACSSDPGVNSWTPLVQRMNQR